MGIPTHVMEYSSGWAATMGGGSGRLQFLGPLSAFGKDGNWFVTFYALPPGRNYEEVRHETTTEYIQAAGDAEAMMLDIRKAGGEQWGAKWVRYFIGRPHDGDLPLDVAIELPKGAEYVSAAEVFAAEEAADIFIAYHRTGDIPPGYVLRAVEGYTADGDNIDLRGAK
ncbi:Uncharacterised protein [Mycobacteroides abscessus subsp. abscessus]|uniref:hypothetical protein n=1 Tax=Mycobacteroides abscessus TaxID=36809 RepID=UPI000928EB71|nr:hypothetical protein [Mycobacteroides abscessus]SHX67378.1 Uncharacterised protein [Mycobacteroides abscessus subsp. abscessus]SIC59121.1 Uncharacterised protein [Mycobacteroides abscessus subsp. abscessus]SKK19971.1 Uncharacterised protein [Mycobacteroides abscessus subsp. abscessus]SKP49813.1 Uncharacterised protein [Mycobacteroides abscessus subsp. abscessus]SKR42147.1 Uncharacterised protein [Mycobacteroides abscessus subsp. abscessus]